MPRGVKFIPPDLGAVLSAYQDGQTALQIAQRCGCSRDTIYRLLKAHGVEVREGGHARRMINAGEVARMYQDGWSVTELAQIFGCYRSTIDHRLFAEGVKPRTPSALPKKGPPGRSRVASRKGFATALASPSESAPAPIGSVSRSAPASKRVGLAQRPLPREKASNGRAEARDDSD